MYILIIHSDEKMKLSLHFSEFNHTVLKSFRHLLLVSSWNNYSQKKNYLIPVLVLVILLSGTITLWSNVFAWHSGIMKTAVCVCTHTKWIQVPFLQYIPDDFWRLYFLSMDLQSWKTGVFSPNQHRYIEGNTFTALWFSLKLLLQNFILSFIPSVYRLPL